MSLRLLTLLVLAVGAMTVAQGSASAHWTFGHGGQAQAPALGGDWWTDGFELRVRFRPQYLHGYAGPLVAGEDFALGLADERFEPAGPKLRFAVGPWELVAAAPLRVGSWHEAGVRLKGGQVELLCDGQVLARSDFPGAARPVRLQVGSRGDPLEQFYGQIDDVELRQRGTWHRMTGWKPTGACRRQADFLPPSAVFRLPCGDARPWRVIQGFAEPGGSHTSYAAFCLDLERADRVAETRGSPFYAVADGRFAVVEHARLAQQLSSGQALDYLHLIDGSARVKAGEEVRAGRHLGSIGDAGAPSGANHLHLALLTRVERPFVTVPFAFKDYEVSDDRGQTWRRVPAGVPRTGQWIRNAGYPQ